MQFRKICDDTSSMSTTELAHNHVFIKDGECWYRDYDREISLRNLMREICSKHGSPADAAEMDDDTLDETLYDNLQYGTDELEGVFALLNMTMWGMADVRHWLENHEKYGLPTTARPEVLQKAADIYGSKAQTDMAIEEMSELTKALLKYRRAVGYDDHKKARADIHEELADAIIMLTQLIMIYGGREQVQANIESKVERLEARMKDAGLLAGKDAAQETMQPAT